MEEISGATFRPCVGGLNPERVAEFYETLSLILLQGGHSVEASRPILVPVDDGSEGVLGDDRAGQAAADSVISQIFQQWQSWCDHPQVAKLAETDLIAHTSGTTTRHAKLAALDTSALLFSARATLDFLGGPGVWVVALPVHHIAGIQMLTRAFLARTQPVVAERPEGYFSVSAFVSATERAVAQLSAAVPRLYTSLVPRQLQRILEDPVAVAAARQFDAILVGGQATPSALRTASKQAGLRLVTTYGSTETAAGCVYDGQPLPGVRVRLGSSGAVEVAGPNLMRGYLNYPSPLSVSEDGTRWLETSDRGRFDDRGRLEILGRLDDLVVIGGLKVSPTEVARCLESHPQVAEAAVVDFCEEGKTRLGAALILRDCPPQQNLLPEQTPPPQPPAAALQHALTQQNLPPHQTLPSQQTPPPKPPAAALQHALTQLVQNSLGKIAVPTTYLALSELPRRGIGKIDRAAVRNLFLSTD